MELIKYRKYPHDPFTGKGLCTGACIMTEKSGTNMKVLYSGIFHYKLPSLPSKVSKSQCHIDIVQYDNGVCCVMMTEGKRSQGISVTNAGDRIATQIYVGSLRKMEADKIVWLEHCPSGRTHNAYIDLVQFQHDIRAAIPGGNELDTMVFSNPQWKRFFEAPHIMQMEFLNTYGYIIKELCNAQMVFAVEDKNDYFWRVWANQEGLMVMTATPSALLPRRVLDVHGVIEVLKNNQQFFGSDINLEEKFTTALMKGFLNKGL